MARLVKYLSIFIACWILLTSVLQFHHHDCSGNIYVHLTSYQDIESENCHECNHSNDCGTNEKQDCSMHIAEYKVSKEYNICNQDLPTQLYSDYTAPRIYIPDEFKINFSDLGIYYPLKYLGYLVMAFRAPPYAFEI